jgi:hypothetical protein
MSFSMTMGQPYSNIQINIDDFRIDYHSVLRDLCKNAEI